MPKVDLNNAFATQSTPERKKVAANATSIWTSGGINFNESKSLLNVISLKLSEILTRENNNFSQDNIESLAYSIEKYGLINPISVVHDEEKDTYTITSGHRRYAALCLLHEWYPSEKDYESVDCSVYELTSDEHKLQLGLPYISKEQEEGIYRDSNLETRQLTYSEVAYEIRHIIERFDDPEYLEKLRKRAAKNGTKTKANTYFDKAKLTLDVLSTQNYSGWKKETVREYIKIWENERHDLIEAIEQGNMKVSAAYKMMIAEQNLSRDRKTNKLTGLTKAVDAIRKEAENKDYSLDEQKEIYEMAQYLLSLVKDYKIENK